MTRTRLSFIAAMLAILAPVADAQVWYRFNPTKSGILDTSDLYHSQASFQARMIKDFGDPDLYVNGPHQGL